MCLHDMLFEAGMIAHIGSRVDKLLDDSTMSPHTDNHSSKTVAATDRDSGMVV
jgi:hypothetical protein